MVEFYVSLAFSVLFQILADRKQIRRFAPALRKAYLILHENRVLFLKPEDTLNLGVDQLEAK